MKIVKPSAAHTARFLSMLPADAAPRAMFGCTAAFVNGNMSCGTWEEGVMVRLSNEDGEELKGLGGQKFMPGGKAMGGYLLLTPSIVADDDELRTWIGRSIAVTRRLPVKVKKTKAPKKK